MSDVPNTLPSNLLDYMPPGAVGDAYIRSAGPIDLIMGPAGSGKTTASIFKCIYFTTAFMPVCRDGVVRAKGTVIRDSYRTLYKTTLPSWFGFFPKNFPKSEFEGGQDRPARHLVRFRTTRGRLVDLQMEFFAVGDQNIEDMLRGYETSFGWLNEADLLSDRVPGFLYSRTGRYPSRTMLADPDAPVPRVVFGDVNPPSVKHWIYERCVKDRDKWPSYRFFRQPSGLAGTAENRRGMPRVSYEEMLATMDEWDARRFVHGEFGYARDGKPVYPEFNHALHVPDQTIAPVKGLPIGIGLDAGMDPAAAVVQVLPDGQIRVLAELVSAHGTGPERFSEALVRLLLERFQGCPLAWVFGDPAAFYGVDRLNGNLGFMDVVGRALGRPVMPSPSNEPPIRLDAVRWYLNRMIDGRRPGFMIDPACVTLIEGFVSTYRYAKERRGATVGLADRPDKNDASHPHDALQYIVLGIRGRHQVITDAASLGRPPGVMAMPRGSVAGGGFNVFKV